MLCAKCAAGYIIQIEDDRSLIIFRYPQSIKDADNCVASLVRSNVPITENVLKQISRELNQQDIDFVLTKYNHSDILFDHQ